jgi:hypothetical protein
LEKGSPFATGRRPRDSAEGLPEPAASRHCRNSRKDNTHPV